MSMVENSNKYHTIINTDLLDNLNNGAEDNQGNNGVTEATILPSVQQSLKDIIAKEGFTFHKIFNRMISTNGGNFLGDLHEIDIKGETKDGYKEIHIFLKQVIPGESIKSLIDIDLCYLKEQFFYTELNDVFKSLQNDADIPEEERFKIIKSYECNSDAIFLENLAKKGFKSLHRMDVMPIKYAELTIAQLAKLHGLSFAMKHKRKDYFENKIKTMKSPLNFNDLHLWKPFVKRQFENSSRYFDSDIQKKIDNFVETFIEKFPKYFTGVTDSVKCMVHGDYKTSNIMVRDNEEVVVVDYQFAFYGSPAIDVIYLMYTGTDGEFRKAHMNNLKDLYHRELTKFLKYFDLDVNDVYPKKVYEKDIEDLLDLGLMTTLYISPLIFTEESDVPDFGKDAIEDLSFKMDDRHKQRVTEIVEEYLEWGILQ